MIAPINTDDYSQVPETLRCNPVLRRFHAWKASAVVKACVPFSRLVRSPHATRPGILMYHRVVPRGQELPTWNVSPEKFRSQLAGLLDRGYVAWSLSQLIEQSQTGGPIPENVFVVTFDDGYANNFLYALPILKELQVPATIFLATAYLNSTVPFPFDDWFQKGTSQVCSETWRALTYHECEQLLDSGVVEFGSHTHTHEDFRGRPDAFRDNLSESMDLLRDRFGIVSPTLSLPYGIVKAGFAGPEYFETAKQLGACCCLTTEEELLSPGSSPFGWGRFIAEEFDTASTIAVKLDGWRDAARDTWRRVRGR